MSEEKVGLPVFYGVKSGMTRVFDDNGNHVPVTVIKLISNKISQVKTNDNDGYEAYQVAYYEKREKLISKPALSHLKKANIKEAYARLSEIRTEGVDANNVGKELSLEHFPAETFVDITGVTKGKGFQGVIKRYNFSGGPATHGSHLHRSTGSIGNRATPGKVFAGKKMPGHMGSKQQTVQNLKVFSVNEDKGFLLIKGSIPGAKNSFVRIAKSVKKN